MTELEATSKILEHLRKKNVTQIGAAEILALMESLGLLKPLTKKVK